MFERMKRLWSKVWVWARTFWGWVQGAFTWLWAIFKQSYKWPTEKILRKWLAYSRKEEANGKLRKIILANPIGQKYKGDFFRYLELHYLPNLARILVIGFFTSFGVGVLVGYEKPIPKQEILNDLHSVYVGIIGAQTVLIGFLIPVSLIIISIIFGQKQIQSHKFRAIIYDSYAVPIALSSFLLIMFMLYPILLGDLAKVYWRPFAHTVSGFWFLTNVLATSHFVYKVLKTYPTLEGQKDAVMRYIVNVEWPNYLRSIFLGDSRDDTPITYALEEAASDVVWQINQHNQTEFLYSFIRMIDMHSEIVNLLYMENIGNEELDLKRIDADLSTFYKEMSNEYDIILSLSIDLAKDNKRFLFLCGLALEKIYNISREYSIEDERRKNFRLEDIFLYFMGEIWEKQSETSEYNPRERVHEFDARLHLSCTRILLRERVDFIIYEGETLAVWEQMIVGLYDLVLDKGITAGLLSLESLQTCLHQNNFQSILEDQGESATKDILRQAEITLSQDIKKFQDMLKKPLHDGNEEGTA